jgi:hypothetical protein
VVAAASEEEGLPRLRELFSADLGGGGTAGAGGGCRRGACEPRRRPGLRYADLCRRNGGKAVAAERRERDGGGGEEESRREGGDGG